MSDYRILHYGIYLEDVIGTMPIQVGNTHSWNFQDSCFLILKGLDEPKLCGMSDLTLINLYFVVAKHLDKCFVDLRARCHVFLIGGIDNIFGKSMGRVQYAKHEQ